MKFFKPRDKIIVPVVLVLALSAALVPQLYGNLMFNIWPELLNRRSYRDWMSVGPQTGEVAPEIVGASLEGEVIRLSDYRGKVVFLNFWSNSG